MLKKWKLRTLLVLYIVIAGCIGLTLTTYLNYKKEAPNFGKMFWRARDAEWTNEHYCKECIFPTSEYYSRHKGGGANYKCRNLSEKYIIIWKEKPECVGGREGVQAPRTWYYPAKIWIFVKDVLGIDLGETK